jgi:hypothetical protein
MATTEAPRQVSVNFGRLTDADIAANIGRAVRPAKGRRSAPGFGQQTLIRGAIEALSTISPARAGLLPSLATMASRSASISYIAGPALSVLRGGEFTVAEGFVGSGGAGLTAGLGAGVYAWMKRPGAELGLYGSISVGYMTNIGFGAGACVSLMFGPAPAVLGGDSIALEVDIGIDVITVSGLIYLSAPSVTSVWPPVIGPGYSPQVIGVGFQVTAGMSILPANIAVSASRTWLRPAVTLP